VDPKSVGSGLVAAHHARIGWGGQTSLSPPRSHRRAGAFVAADRPAARPLPGADHEAQSPLPPSEIHRHHERRSRRSTSCSVVAWRSCRCPRRGVRCINGLPIATFALKNV
jgi:hypothetical protein